MRRWAFEQGLSLFFLALFLATLIGQSFAGQHNYNAEQIEHGSSPVSWWEYVASSNFGAAVMENWQSEWLQFILFAMATIWLIQRGSNESKSPEEVGLESDQKQRVRGYAAPASPAWAKVDGLRRRVYENSFLLAMTLVFLGSWFAQSVTNWTEFNADQKDHDQGPISYGQYLGNADFWERTLQNWQSEFLAVGTMAVFTIYLRQRGSPESKPVGAPHAETGTSG